MLKLILEAFILILQFPNIVIQLLLFLLNPSMVDFLEIPLLAKLIISRAGLLSDNPCLIHLLLELCEHVGELDIILVNIGNIWHLIQIQLSSRL